MQGGTLQRLNIMSFSLVTASSFWFTQMKEKATFLCASALRYTGVLDTSVERRLFMHVDAFYLWRRLLLTVTKCIRNPLSEMIFKNRVNNLWVLQKGIFQKLRDSVLKSSYTCCFLRGFQGWLNNILGTASIHFLFVMGH